MAREKTQTKAELLTTLFGRIRNGEAAEVRVFLAKHPETARLANIYGDTALHMAARFYNVNTDHNITLLINTYDADIEAINAAGKTPLQCLKDQDKRPDTVALLSPKKISEYVPERPVFVESEASKSAREREGARLADIAKEKANADILAAEQREKVERAIGSAAARKAAAFIGMPQAKMIGQTLAEGKLLTVELQGIIATERGKNFSIEKAKQMFVDFFKDIYSSPEQRQSKRQKDKKPKKKEVNAELLTDLNTFKDAAFESLDALLPGLYKIMHSHIVRELAANIVESALKEGKKSDEKAEVDAVKIKKIRDILIGGNLSVPVPKLEEIDALLEPMAEVLYSDALFHGEQAGKKQKELLDSSIIGPFEKSYRRRVPSEVRGNIYELVENGNAKTKKDIMAIKIKANALLRKNRTWTEFLGVDIKEDKAFVAFQGGLIGVSNFLFNNLNDNNPRTTSNMSRRVAGAMICGLTYSVATYVVSNIAGYFINKRPDINGASPKAGAGVGFVDAVEASNGARAAEIKRR